MTDDYIEHLESREMLAAKLETSEELVQTLQTILGQFEDEYSSSSRERPYVITIEVYRADYKRVFDMVSRALPDGLDIFMSGGFVPPEPRRYTLSDVVVGEPSHDE